MASAREMLEAMSYRVYISINRRSAIIVGHLVSSVKMRRYDRVNFFLYIMSKLGARSLEIK